MIYREKHDGTIMVLDDIYRKLPQYENYYGVYLMIHRKKHYGTIMVLDDIYRNYYDTKTIMVYT